MHLNKTNGKVYIGQTKTSYGSRWNNGKGYGRCSRFAKAIKKYGWNGFEHIALIEGLSKIDVDYFERFFIAFFDSQNPEFGYNLTAGGDERPLDNPVVRAKYEESMKKIHADPEWQKKHHEFLKKLHADSEWREKVREACCKKVLCVETKIVYGSLQEATVAVNLKTSGPICMCCRGERETAGGYHWEYVDEELKNKYAPYASKCKRVLCVETGVIYPTPSCAASFVGLARNGIYGCCRGRQKTCGGYHWEYV